MRFLSTWLITAAACAVASAETPRTTVTHPMYGVTLTTQVQQDLPQRVYWVQVDVTDPAVHLRVCPGGIAPAPPWEVKLQTVSKIAWREHLDVAVNGSYFSANEKKLLFGIPDPYFAGNLAMACGWTVCDRVLLSDHATLTQFTSTLIVAGDGKVSIQKLTGPPVGARQAVSGIQLVRDGRNICEPGFNEELPRTTVGVDAAGKILTLMVVDGHRPDYSQGMTPSQAANFLVKLGCYAALDLDGGGSSTMVVRNGEHWPVINTPSDGHTLVVPLSIERPVADALGIVIDPPAK
jgi:exopolysaccharide biosynthesis protein